MESFESRSLGRMFAICEASQRCGADDVPRMELMRKKDLG